MRRFTALTAAILFAFGLPTVNAAIIFDDFNVNEGRFALAPTFSGSSSGMSTASTADRVTTDSPLEGAGHQKLVLLDDTVTPGGTSRLRHLSGGGAAGGASGQPANTVFSVGAGTDGWVGFYLKTTTAGWNAQLWIEGPENNGSSQKNVIADGLWHLYEWNLDDESGGPNGWQATGVPGIVAGDIDVQAGNYTFDSVLLRHNAMPASSTIFFDFLAKSDGGSIAGLLNMPPTVGNLNEGQVLRNTGTLGLGPLPSSDPEALPLSWSLVSVVGPGSIELSDFVVNPVTGVLDFNSIQESLGAYTVTIRGTDPGGLFDDGELTFEVIIPEPATLTLLGLVLVGMLGFRRRAA